MELNDNYYTDVNTEIDEDYSLRYTPFANLPLNSQFDVSGAFGMCGGAFSPLCNQGIVYGGDFYATKVLFTAVTFTSVIYRLREIPSTTIVI